MTRLFLRSFSAVFVLVIILGVVACGGGSSSKPGITKEVFGEHEGKPVELYTIVNSNGVTLKVSTFGGIITELHVPDRDGKMGDVVLGFDKHSGYVSPEYLKSGPYFGAIIGRYGNRIANGRFTLDDVEYTLATNNGNNHLHGGNVGFNSVLWTPETFEDSEGYTLELKYKSVDMEEGYPGNLQVTVTYTLNDDDELRIEYHATTDKATPCNLTNHSYFNLSAGKQTTIGSHVIVILADKFTEVDGGLIPTGNLPDVVGTPMDFTTEHTVDERINVDFEQLKIGRGYDHNWVLRNSDGFLALAATVYEPESGRFMEVFTTEPGVQFYSGNFLDGTLTGKNGIRYQRRAGLCLETQHFPDSPNQSEFPCTILKPGQIYQSQTVYKFSVK